MLQSLQVNSTVKYNTVKSEFLEEQEQIGDSGDITDMFRINIFGTRQICKLTR